MKTKKEIVENWLPRYTKRPLNEFTDYILLTNFNNYVELFAEWFNVERQRQCDHLGSVLQLYPHVCGAILG